MMDVRFHLSQRYRKDLTSNATDEQLRDFEEIYNYSLKLLNRKEEITNILKEKTFWMRKSKII